MKQKKLIALAISSLALSSSSLYANTELNSNNETRSLGNGAKVRSELLQKNRTMDENADLSMAPKSEKHDKSSEGSCGEMKDGMEGSCGDGMKDGKESSCGGNMKSGKEYKCGKGSCGN